MAQHFHDALKNSQPATISGENSHSKIGRIYRKTLELVGV
jgi:hypothetical protein